MQKTVLRDISLLAVAAALGWWAHGANTTVHAQHSSPGGNFSFQLSGVGRDAKLGVYNPDTHLLYVYPTGAGGSRIGCEYSLHIDRPGAPLDRQNCANGSAF